MSAIELGKYLRGNATKNHECLAACVECLIACEMCSDACLDEKDVAMMATCIRLDRDCAEACAAAIRVMARGGPLTAVLCGACADACDACAAECEKHAAMHDHCRMCAEACRKCAEACRSMAGK
ncbi:four-helix bundle copper-binding protein [Gemmatimonas sp.]|uniref:four-helix bundle copper-binding protein n=1 Tax=Gemmatimonas sp. TaxID=1962908 RepID=UPI003567B23E